MGDVDVWGEQRHHRQVDLAEVQTGDRVVVLNLARPSDAPIILSGSASQVWVLIDGLRSTVDISEALSVSRSDVGAVIRQLAALHLVRVAE